MPHLPQITTEQAIFIIFGLLLVFIGIPLSFICGCCNRIHKNRDDHIIVNNSKLIKDYP